MKNNNHKNLKPIVTSTLFFCTSIIIVFIFIFGIKYIGSLKECTKMPIHSVDVDNKRISLSFDVAWGSKNIDDILEILDKYELKTTFFMVGSWIDDNEELVKKIDKNGHEIGNHSDTHANVLNLSKEDVELEIENTAKKISKVTSKEATLYRPPFGEIDDKTIEICEELGYKPIKWSIDSLDWKELGPVHITEKVIKESQPGSIILFHANVENNKEYLDSIISNLLEDGYEIVPVSELIYQEDYTIDSLGIQKVSK